MSDSKRAASRAHAVSGDRRVTVVRSVTFILAACLIAGSLSLSIGRPAVGASTTSSPADIVARLVDRLAQVSGALAQASVSSARSAEDPRGEKIRPAPRSGPFSMNLYRRGDFVSQQTEYWCVVASVQTMMNIMEPGRPDRSGSTQRKLQFQARRLDRDDDDYWRARMSGERWRKGHHGLGLQDWVGLLNANGYGPYEIDRAATRKQAIRKAARAIRSTGKPAGLVVWRGAHAWVMSGFTATADPAYTNDYKVTRVNIQDPWYPAISSIWGASRPPNAAVPVRALDQDFLRYDRPGRRHPKRDGRFMLILPAASPSASG